MRQKEFFENLDFTFGSDISDIKPCEINISENIDLKTKLNGSVYKFVSPEHSNTSFYVISIALTAEELFEVKRYIWNENKFDLYFISENSCTTLYYAKSNPRENNNKIASFTGNDSNEIEKIKKWHFNSGTFWLNYSDFLDNVKNRTRIDKKLIEQLTNLKKKLKNELASIIPNRDEIVQALIDRTLFIKFLEDNHIINSYFYNYHFPNRFDEKSLDFGYKTFLKAHDIKSINSLFEKINLLFNSVLFKTPPIDDEFLTDRVLDLIYHAIRQTNWETKELSLFDFRFDVIPIEFISHIYEVFLEGKQLNEGIYYTPDKLAQLIIDDTVNKAGTILDPACGSGMFLVLAFRKILEFLPSKCKKVDEIIEYKSQLLKKYIFGIEKEKIAWRLSIFSLYLEILKDINPDEIKKYIEQKLKETKNNPIFPIDFSENILPQNSLETQDDKKAHKDKTFDFIVGNPPFFEIEKDDLEISFINEHTITIDGTCLKANEIIGHNQISQAFMLKLKDWAKPETRFGFVQNSSNFYNELSENFQKFFFEQYQIESFYELSKVKKILFRKAKENVIVTIFNNKKIENNTINYYPVDLGVFSEIFDLLIIQEDKKIEIKQQDVLNNKTVLRYYFKGNTFDLELIQKLSEYPKIKNDLDKNKGKLFIHEGLKIVGEKSVCKYFKISKSEWNSYSRETQENKYEEFKSIFTSKVLNKQHYIPYIEPKNINPYYIAGHVNYMGNISDFERPRQNELYTDERIIWNRTGGYIKACYVKDNIYFNFDIHVIKLKNNLLYYLYTSIINSELINYFLNVILRKRQSNSFPKISNVDFIKIPIPKNLDEDLVTEITEISKQLTEGKLKYEGEIKDKLNELIFDLYDLNILEITRIKHFFEPKREVTKKDLDEYKTALSQTLRLYFVNKPEIVYYPGVNLPFGMVITAIYFDNAKENNPESKKSLQYIITKILQEQPEMRFISMNEKIYGKNCIFIVKDKQYHSWSSTKAYEDGQDIIKKIVR